MNSVAFIVLTLSVVFAAGADNTESIAKVLSSVKSSRDAASDLLIVES